MAYDEFDKKLGEILRAEREAAGLSQQDMADRLGLTKMTISHWENGNRSMKASSLKDYCAVLGITAQYVFELMEASNG